VKWHEGKTCEEQQLWECGGRVADVELAEYRRTNRVVRCPTCGHGLEKISGCNHVV